MADNKALNEPLLTANTYIEKYNKSVVSTNQTAAILLIVILFSWAYIIEPLNVKYFVSRDKYLKELSIMEDSLRTTLAQRAFVADEIRSMVDKEKESKETGGNQKPIAQIISEYRQTKPAENSEEAKRTDSLLKAHEKLIQRRDSLKANLKSVINIQSTDSQDFLKEIPFPFKTIFYFTNNLKNGPQAIIFLIMCFVIYCYLKRRAAIDYAARAIRLYKSHGFWDGDKLNDIIVTAPFWIVPIPPKKNKELSNEEFIMLLGHSSVKKSNYVFVCVILFSLFLIQLRQLILAFGYERYHVNFQYTINCFILITTFIFILIWLFPIYIPDKQINEPITVSDTRRRFIISSGVLVLGGIVGLNSRRLLRVFLKDKYEKIKKSWLPTMIISGWYLNSKTHRKHFFNKQGSGAVMKNIGSEEEFKNFKKRIIPIADDKMTLPQMTSVAHIRSVSVLEEYILTLLQNKTNVSAVYTVLSEFLDRHPRNYHLWDLAAKIKFLYQNDNVNVCFKEMCSRHAGGFNKTLFSRIEKYNSATWQKKMLSKKKSVVFNGKKII